MKFGKKSNLNLKLLTNYNIFFLKYFLFKEEVFSSFVYDNKNNKKKIFVFDFDIYQRIDIKLKNLSSFFFLFFFASFFFRRKKNEAKKKKKKKDKNEKNFFLNFCFFFIKLF